VIVVGPPLAAAMPAAETLDDALARAMAGRPLKEAVADVAAGLGMPRKAVYARALALRDGAAHGG